MIFYSEFFPYRYVIIQFPSGQIPIRYFSIFISGPFVKTDWRVSLGIVTGSNLTETVSRYAADHRSPRYGSCGIAGIDFALGVVLADYSADTFHPVNITGCIADDDIPFGCSCDASGIFLFRFDRAPGG